MRDLPDADRQHRRQELRREYLGPHRGR
jgi:hypothetical protein